MCSKDTANFISFTRLWGRRTQLSIHLSFPQRRVWATKVSVLLRIGESCCRRISGVLSTIWSPPMLVWPPALTRRRSSASSPSSVTLRPQPRQNLSLVIQPQPAVLFSEDLQVNHKHHNLRTSFCDHSLSLNQVNNQCNLCLCVRKYKIQFTIWKQESFRKYFGPNKTQK